jgi:hypothetical protein
MILSKLEKATEALIKDTVNPGDNVAFRLSWSAAEKGSVYGVDNAEKPINFAIAAGNLTFDAYSSPIAEATIALSVSFRRDVYPDAAVVSRLMAAVDDLLIRLQLDPTNELVDRLSSKNFKIGGVKILDFANLELMVEESAYLVSRTFSVKGVIRR